jgi:hypothetical protein
MYVRDLETKSRYLEGECRRLGRLLQCCYAENQALRLSLQSVNAFGAPMTKQESAVLLLGMNILNHLLLLLSLSLSLLYIVVDFTPNPLRATIGIRASITA